MKTIFRSMVLATAIAALSTGAQAAKYKEVSVTNGGSIIGSVSAGANQASVKKYTISKDTEICGTGIREVQNIRVNDGALLDAVVFLEKMKEGKAFPSDLKKLTINQSKCEFQPYLSVVSNNGELEAVNSDATLHNIHTYELIGKARRTMMNVSQPDKGSIVTKKVKMRKGVGMKVECDAHDFMHAFVFVPKNPYFSVVDGAGKFEIKDVPAGKYKIVVFHGTLGQVKGKVEVAAGGATTYDLTY